MFILPVVIGFSSYALNRAYVKGLDSAEYEAMLSQIYALLAIAEPGNEGMVMPSIMANPRFETPESGLYARILDARSALIWQSNSLDSSALSLPKQDQPQAGSLREYWYNKDSKTYRSLLLTTIWELDGADATFSFEVAHAQDEKQREIQQYRKSLLSWLSGMALLLLLFQVLITLWGLRPLKALAKEIEAVERGEEKNLQASYPIEIEPVTESLNKLLDSESNQRERYKNSLADLAHSLKTPLSVIRSQLVNNEQGKVVDEQIKRMSDIINHQLRRASAQVNTLYGPSVQLKPITNRVINALQKVYRDKHMLVSNHIAEGLNAAISEDDCMEVFGNIIENAFKYGLDTIQLKSENHSDGVYIFIGDNGPGIDKALSETILERGARADTSKSGQGIGLAIAVDILSSYNGALSVARSALGGAEFRITIPK